MIRSTIGAAFCGILLAGLVAADEAPKQLQQKPNTWVKRSPLKDGPVSPGMGYEASLGYDPLAKRVIRWGGHNQGGGGEQNAETWVYDPATARWELKEPNTSPPGVCCAQQNVFDADQGRFLRFPAFSGSHGWQWFREIYLNNSTVWNYDLASNTWRDRRPLPAPRVRPLRCAAWDSDHQVVVIFGGEGSHEGTLVYDPYVNEWTRMNPKVQPAFRSGGNMAYDAARKLHVLFGSQFSNDRHTWTYDLRKNEWRDRKPEKQPPTDRNDAVLAYDPNSKVVIAVVRAIEGGDGKEIAGGHLETWAYDAGRNEWTRMKPPREPDGWGNRRRILVAVPDQNVILMEVFVTSRERVPGVKREQQIWTYRYANAPKDDRPEPPTGVQVTTNAEGGAKVTWKRNPAPGIESYAIYRGTGKKPWLVDYERAGKVDGDQTSFVDRDLKPATVHYYFVRAVTKDGRESGDSKKVRTQPRIVEDVVVSVLSPNEVRLTWKAPPGDDIAGYRVERAVVEVFSEDQIKRLKRDTPPLNEPSVGAIKAVGQFVRLTDKPVKEAAYTDKAVDLAKPQATEGKPLYEARFRADQLDDKGKPYRYAVYAYRIRAVNVLGVAGGPSPYFLTIPAAPRWLFSKEDGEKCHLKWRANFGQKLLGYRVYRMESPRRNGPGQPVTRLTADPLKGSRFTDEKASKATRRYWVVAVDALGQEGFPSAPTWHLRQWRRYYVPFVGEWHQ